MSDETQDIILWVTGLIGLVILFTGMVLWICFAMEQKSIRRPLDADARARLARRKR